MPVLYGADHPYGIPPSGLGDAKAVTAVTRDQLAAFHATWIRPDNARVFVVGDTTLAEVKKQLDATLGQWKAPATAKPVKHFDIAIPAPQTAHPAVRPAQIAAVGDSRRQGPRRQGR